MRCVRKFRDSPETPYFLESLEGIRVQLEISQPRTLILVFDTMALFYYGIDECHLGPCQERLQPAKTNLYYLGNLLSQHCWRTSNHKFRQFILSSSLYWILGFWVLSHQAFTGNLLLMFSGSSVKLQACSFINCMSWDMGFDKITVGEVSAGVISLPLYGIEGGGISRLIFPWGSSEGKFAGFSGSPFCLSWAAPFWGTWFWLSL